MTCLRLWTYMAVQPSLQEAFKPLVYPLIQVIDSTVMLIPTARYYPMRLHCADLYNQLISATGVFIPVAPLLLDVIEVRLSLICDNRTRSSWRSRDT